MLVNMRQVHDTSMNVQFLKFFAVNCRHNAEFLPIYHDYACFVSRYDLLLEDALTGNLVFLSLQTLIFHELSLISRCEYWSM